MTKLQIEFLLDVDAELEKPINLGSIPHGRLIIFHVKGGRFVRPKMRGNVLLGGGKRFS